MTKRLHWLGLFLLGFVMAEAADPAAAKRVALVFDDGPRPADVELLLQVLAKEDVHVTFAVVGNRVKESPAAARLIHGAGHEIANHSRAHLHARDLDDATLAGEVAVAQQQIGEAVGVLPRWYWPPYLEVDDRVRGAVAKAGIKLYEPRQVVVSMDYELSVPAPEIYRRATTGVKDGAVILFHEWRKETRDELPRILAELRRQGCVFLTFTALYESLASPAARTGAADPGKSHAAGAYSLSPVAIAP